MIATSRRLVAVLLPLALSPTLLSQQQDAPKEFVGEGVVVAFQKYNRYPVMGPVRGVANFVEFWIVRVDKWANEVEPLKQKKYFRVEYNIYERGLTDYEINALRLRFKLRELRENERTDCMGTRRESSDYVRTTPGQLDDIPPLDSLPCLIADQPPIRIPE
jgi:hypothetical protein